MSSWDYESENTYYEVLGRIEALLEKILEKLSEENLPPNN